ncbi:Hsp70 family protein [Pontiella sulfatireligans]|uniref:Chaperone protein DnaK n=1 Tax=Pontiella sulfatireligans TaxID=2750658 RepID=A0A6C2UWC0_9BACT|nr:Hsp70 family protein [Pontiella sulfatireligans]VGO23136.1 Chaperone protein DnaK [Pontiella sulfatireligans]
MSKIAGIDLGTTFSAISHLNNMGRPDIIANRDGERIMPSAVFFSPDGRILTGEEAIRSRYDDVGRSVRWIKKHMGDAEHKRTIDGKDYTPAELSSLILKKLHQDASPQVGEITDVVISIPANFGEVARKATMDAGKIAGLNVVGIVNEPTAAAFYYAITHEIQGHVLIFDLGGGTFDVSIANVAGQDIEIVASSGDSNLGGYNFDQKLTEFFAQKYKEETGGNLYSDDEEKAEIEDYAEKTKKSLSKKDSVSYKLKGDSGRVQGTITRSEYDSLISSDLARIEMLIETALDEAEDEASDIDKVLLVGGSSRIPAVQSLLKKMFKYEPSLIGNVDECVSLGAALYAGLRMLEDNPSQVDAGIAAGLSDVKVGDVCNHSYGTLCIAVDEVTQAEALTNVIIIPKNTAIPCEVNDTFYTRVDGQEKVNTRVTQGESADPDLIGDPIAEGFLELPQGLPPGSPVEIKYSYDKDQRMTCVFTEPASGKSKVFDLDLKSGESSERTIEGQKAKLADFTIE